MDELKNLRQRMNLSNKDIIAAVQEYSPKFDKTLLSKVGRADYGVTLRGDILNSLIEQFAPEAKAQQKAPKQDRHRLECRISCRLENGDYNLLQQAMKTEGFGTVQSFLTYMIKRYIARHTPTKNRSKTT